MGREDFTGVPLPTIDPEDARDHDDAVWVQRNEDGTYTAWIAIADVSHYMRPETALDNAALARSCSIYLPTRAIPMLPRALSSNLCSLLPDVIRLCLCLVVQLDAGANVTEYRVAEGFMKSRAKLTYGGVARALGFTDKPPVQEAAEAMVEDLKVADTLSQILRSKRLRRGALDFTVPEPKIVLDKETEAPIGVEKRSEDPGMVRAYQLIEELMLMRRFPQPQPGPGQLPYFWGGAIVNAVAWHTSSLAGIFLGDRIPAHWGLGFAGTMARLGMTCTLLTDRATWIPAALAMAAAVAAYALPLRLNILVAIAAAVALGLVIDHSRPLRRGLGVER